MVSVQSGETHQTTKKNVFLLTLFICAACLVSCGVYYHVFIAKALVEVEIQTEARADFKIYWASGDQPYSEQRVAGSQVKAGENRVSFLLTDIGKINRLRIDPINHAGSAVIQSVSITQEGYKPISLSATEDFSRIKPLHQIVGLDNRDNTLIVNSSGIDPTLELTVTPEFTGHDRRMIAARLTVICVLVSLVCWYGRSLVVELRFVPVLLFGVWGLVMVMGVITKENVHPDEYVHLAAVHYYQDNWLPPDITDPAINDSFSVYGFSRLGGKEIYYLFAGKFSKLSSSLNLPDFVTSRLFNILLFGIFFFYTVKSVNARIVALPLLISPQIWYIYSYCNSDGFALAVSFIGACQIVDRGSLLHRYLRGDGLVTRGVGVVAFGLLLATLLLVKKNYYPFVALFYFCILLKLFFTEEFFWERRDAVIRLLAFTVLGLTIFGARVGLDYLVNGADFKAKAEAMQEFHADYAYKSSTPIEQSNSFLYNKAKGVSLEEVIKKYRWFERTVNNSFGNFGYGDITASPIYYNLMQWSALLLAVFSLVYALARGGASGASVILVVAGLFGALVLASLHHSWVDDFQPQGRYLFVLFPMLGVIYGWKPKMIHKPVTTLLVMCMFLLSTYFFVYQGLARIPKMLS